MPASFSRSMIMEFSFQCHTQGGRQRVVRLWVLKVTTIRLWNKLIISPRSPTSQPSIHYALSAGQPLSSSSSRSSPYKTTTSSEALWTSTTTEGIPIISHSSSAHYSIHVIIWWWWCNYLRYVLDISKNDEWPQFVINWKSAVISLQVFRYRMDNLNLLRPRCRGQEKTIDLFFARNKPPQSSSWKMFNWNLSAAFNWNRIIPYFFWLPLNYLFHFPLFVIRELFPIHNIPR